MNCPPEDEQTIDTRPIELWERVFLGANIIKLLRQMLQRKSVNPESQFLESSVEKLHSMLAVMSLTGINTDKIESV